MRTHFSAVYMNQEFHVPVVVSSDLNARATLWTTVVPTTAAVLAYHFVLRPRRRRERLAYVAFSRVRTALTRPCPAGSSARHAANCAKPNRT